MLRMQLITLLILITIGVRAGIIKPSITDSPTCQCVSKHMCMDNESGANIKDLVDIRYSSEKCRNKDEICCISLKQKLSQKAIIELEAEGNNETKGPLLPENILPNSCGYQTVLADRIIGGGMLTMGELPWTVAILFTDGKIWKFLCSGSIIHPSVILTAGHCVYKYEAEELMIRAGEIDNESESEPFPHQDSFIVEREVHPEFNVETLKNDIALLLLGEPLIISYNVRIACLPSGNLSSVINSNCEIGGYGVSGPLMSFTGKQLHKVDIELVKRKECVHILRSTRLGGHFNLHKSFICAGGTGGEDACKGDGGAALVCPMKKRADRFVQVGIVSWGMGCASGIPGIYTNVNLFRNWINEKMIDRNFNISVNTYY